MALHPGIFVGFALFVGALVFLRWEMSRMFAEEKARSRSPFKEKLLRPPGESLRLKIEEIREELMEKGIVLAVLLVVPGFLIILVKTPKWEINVIIWSAVSIIDYGAAYRQWKKVKGLRETLRKHRLGFDGERYVAEKLGELSAQGYRVFHDFIFDMKPGGDATNFNFDHIVIGTNGIFLVETKGIRQPNGEMPDGQESHKVIVNGDVLEFPTGYKARVQIAQAKRNAEDLSKWLTGTASTPVPVHPLLILPGWYVESRNGTIPVLNGKSLGKIVPKLGREDAWTAGEVRAFSDRIEAHCRNVEGA